MRATNMGVAFTSAGAVLIALNTSCQVPQLSLSKANVVFVGARAGDQLGWSASWTEDATGDEVADLWAGAPQSDQGQPNGGVAALLPGAASGTVSAMLADSLLVGEASSDAAGQGLTSRADLNGDGIADVVIAAPRADRGGADAGCVYVFYGPISGDGSVADADAAVCGDLSGDRAGTSFSAASDVNGDGITDLAIGAPGHDGGGTDAGAVALFYGPVVGARRLANADVFLPGEAPGAATGTAVDIGGDFNGDGLADLALGAPGVTSGAGRSYLIYGPASYGTLQLIYADVRLDGMNPGDNSGAALTRAGDINADGTDDLLIGAPAEDSNGADAGSAYVLTAPFKPGQWKLSDVGYQLRGEAPGDAAGWALAPAGDVNLDGLDDILIGAPGSDSGGTDSGAAYVVKAPFGASATLPSTGVRLGGAAGADNAGRFVASAGDLDRDGRADVMVGAPYADGPGGVDAGALYVVFAARL